MQVLRASHIKIRQVGQRDRIADAILVKEITKFHKIRIKMSVIFLQLPCGQKQNQLPAAICNPVLPQRPQRLILHFVLDHCLQNTCAFFLSHMLKINLFYYFF